TQVVTGSVVGSGVGRRAAEVRWGLAGRVVTAWVVTLPSAALVGALAWRGATAIGGAAGVLVVFAVAVAAAFAIYRASRVDPVNAANVNGTIGDAVTEDSIRV